MKCPKDGETFKEVKFGGIPLDICPKCDGVWMDWGKMRRVSSDIVTEYELMYRGESDIRCPKCHKLMEMADLHSAIVEKCDCGVFFDAEEANKVLGRKLDIHSNIQITINPENFEKLKTDGKISIDKYDLVLED